MTSIFHGLIDPECEFRRTAHSELIAKFFPDMTFSAVKTREHVLLDSFFFFFTDGARMHDSDIYVCISEIFRYIHARDAYHPVEARILYVLQEHLTYDLLDLFSYSLLPVSSTQIATSNAAHQCR